MVTSREVVGDKRRKMAIRIFIKRIENVFVYLQVGQEGTAMKSEPM